MTPSKKPTFALLALSLALAASPALGYVIVLKDGTRLEAKAKPTRQGKNVLFQTKLGANQMIPAADVDEEKTEAINREGVGDAYILNQTREVAAPTQQKMPSLSDHIKSLEREGKLKPPEPTPAQEDTRLGAVPRIQTKSEQRDAKEPAVDSVLAESFQRALDASNVKGSRLASIPSGLKIQVVTDSEPQVFATLGAVARGMKDARATGKDVSKVELILATSTNEPAGRFLMTPDDADSILTGKLDVRKYFLQAVQF